MVKVVVPSIDKMSLLLLESGWYPVTDMQGLLITMFRATCYRYLIWVILINLTIDEFFCGFRSYEIAV